MNKVVNFLETLYLSLYSHIGHAKDSIFSIKLGMHIGKTMEGIRQGTKRQTSYK